MGFFKDLRLFQGLLKALRVPILFRGVLSVSKRDSYPSFKGFLSFLGGSYPFLRGIPSLLLRGSYPVFKGYVKGFL